MNAPFDQWIRTDVVVVRWPEQRAEADRLAALSMPRLLLVEPGAPPPPTVHCLEDWVRLPVDDGDLRVRLDALAHRASQHPPVPQLHPFGELSFRGQAVFLTPTDRRIAAVLVSAFDHGVSEDDLFTKVWPAGGNRSKLRVHVSRLRKQLAPLSLEITSIRNSGYRMHKAGSFSIPSEPRQATVNPAKCD